MTKAKDQHPKMSIKPPGQMAGKDAAAMEFIEGAPGGSLKREAPPANDVVLPWEEPGVRADVIKQYNLRLSEPALLKLRYVVEHRLARSINSYILEALLPRLDEDIASLAKHGTK